MGRGQAETSWQKHQTMREMQSTEVYLSGFNALCTFSHLLHEVKIMWKWHEDKQTMLLHLSIFYEYQQFVQHLICFSIQPPDYSDPWPR
jgi:hypothetical protein